MNEYDDIADEEKSNQMNVDPKGILADNTPSRVPVMPGSEPISVNINDPATPPVPEPTIGSGYIPEEPSPYDDIVAPMAQKKDPWMNPVNIDIDHGGRVRVGSSDHIPLSATQQIELAMGEPDDPAQMPKLLEYIKKNGYQADIKDIPIYDTDENGAQTPAGSKKYIVYKSNKSKEPGMYALSLDSLGAMATVTRNIIDFSGPMAAEAGFTAAKAALVGSTGGLGLLGVSGLSSATVAGSAAAYAGMREFRRNVLGGPAGTYDPAEDKKDPNLVVNDLKEGAMISGAGIALGVATKAVTAGSRLGYSLLKPTSRYSLKEGETIATKGGFPINEQSLYVKNYKPGTGYIDAVLKEISEAKNFGSTALEKAKANINDLPAIMNKLVDDTFTSVKASAAQRLADKMGVDKAQVFKMIGMPWSDVKKMMETSHLSIQDKINFANTEKAKMGTILSRLQSDIDESKYLYTDTIARKEQAVKSEIEGITKRKFIEDIGGTGVERDVSTGENFILNLKRENKNAALKSSNPEVMFKREVINKAGNDIIPPSQLRHIADDLEEFGTREGIFDPGIISKNRELRGRVPIEDDFLGSAKFDLMQSSAKYSKSDAKKFGANNTELANIIADLRGYNEKGGMTLADLVARLDKHSELADMGIKDYQMAAKTSLPDSDTAVHDAIRKSLRSAVKYVSPKLDEYYASKTRIEGYFSAIDTMLSDHGSNLVKNILNGKVNQQVHLDLQNLEKVVGSDSSKILRDIRLSSEKIAGYNSELEMLRSGYRTVNGKLEKVTKFQPENRTTMATLPQVLEQQYKQAVEDSNIVLKREAEKAQALSKIAELGYWTKKGAQGQRDTTRALLAGVNAATEGGISSVHGNMSAEVSQAMAITSPRAQMYFMNSMGRLKDVTMDAMMGFGQYSPRGSTAVKIGSKMMLAPVKRKIVR